MSRFFPSTSLAALPVSGAGAAALGGAPGAVPSPGSDPFAALAPRTPQPAASPAPSAPSAPPAPGLPQVPARPVLHNTPIAEAVPGADESADETSGPRFLSIHGMSALVPGLVDGLAYELVGPEVAVKAVWAAMVGPAHRSLNSTKLLLDGEKFALDAGVKYRSVQAALGDGLLSLLILHPDALVGGLSMQDARGKSRRRRKTHEQPDETARGERTHLSFIYRAEAVDTDTGVPEGFADALATTLRLPFRRAWVSDLWARGRAAGLIVDVEAHGGLAGVRVTLNSARWAGPLGEIVRGHAGDGGVGAAAA